MSEVKRHLYKLRKKDVEKGDVVLTDAFRNDPLWNIVLAGSKPEQSQGLFKVPILYGLKYGKVYATSENLEGIITWFPGELAERPLPSYESALHTVGQNIDSIKGVWYGNGSINTWNSRFSNLGIPDIRFSN